MASRIIKEGMKMTIEDIRNKMQQVGIEAYVITHGNRFIGQDILPEENKLEYLTGFSGSAGILAVTAEKAFLLVDGRYELQARQETDATKITVIDATPRLKNVCDLLSENKIKKIGYDTWCHTVAEMEFIKRRYGNLEFKNFGNWFNLDNEKQIAVCDREVRFSGLSSADKIAFLVAEMQEKGADYYLLTSADSVSWLANIYARDLPFSPVVRAYALVSDKGELRLFSGLNDESGCLRSWKEFESLWGSLKDKVVLYDAHSTPEAVKMLGDADIKLVKTFDLCQKLKAEKNKTELQGMINCHVRDGAALSKFLCWLEENRFELTELDVVDKLHEFRKGGEYFFGESFATIAGAGANGAVVHYQPSEKTNIKLPENGLLLIDSGAQYFDGTTDVTRTVALGKPAKEMIADFTMVLKAHIALAQLRFPENLPGDKMDIIARGKLWQHGCDYKHGTGHGVGCFGNVYEGPISISASGSDYGFKSGMVVSNEPGIYRAGLYGIRIENLQYTAKVEGLENEGFLEFKYLTKVPIDKRLIDKYLLNEGERAWLNDYHRNVYDTLAPYMNENEKVWLKDACSPL